MGSRGQALGDALRKAVEREVRARRVLREAREAKLALCRAARAEKVPLTTLARAVLLGQGVVPTAMARRRVAAQLRQLRRRGVTRRHAEPAGPTSSAGPEVTSSATHTNEESSMARLVKKTVTHEFAGADDEEPEKEKDFGADEAEETDEDSVDEEELADDDDDDDEAKSKRKR